MRPLLECIDQLGRIPVGREGAAKEMNNLIDIASEQSREWMEIWGLFVFVIISMFGTMLTITNLERDAASTAV